MAGQFRIGFTDPKGILINKPGIGGLLAVGATVPSDGTSGFSPGCIFIDQDGAAGAQLYINRGTGASCSFKVLDTGGIDLSGLLATATEINRSSDVSTRNIVITANTSLTEATHDGKNLILDLAANSTITLPAATGSGAKFELVVNTTMNGTTKLILQANGSDKLNGTGWVQNATALANAFNATAAQNVTMNGGTMGGIRGDTIIIKDTAAALWTVSVFSHGTGVAATPFGT